MILKRGKRWFDIYRVGNFRIVPTIGMSLAWKEAWWRGFGFNAVIHWNNAK
jgi:hypothetical protein